MPECINVLFNTKGPRTEIMGFEGPNTIMLIVFGP